jgi:hypothetical protein
MRRRHQAASAFQERATKGFDIVALGGGPVSQFTQPFVEDSRFVLLT